MTRKSTKIQSLILILIVFLTLVITGCSSEISSSDGKLEVHYIDVGQADAILIKGPNDQNILIDAGNNGDRDVVLNYLRSQGVKDLKAVIGTHPHEDHIGGLDAVIDNYNIEKVYMPKVSNTTKTFKDVLAAIKNKGLKVTTASKGVNIPLEGITATFLGPIGTDYKDLNDYSAVLKVTFGNNSFLFQGDAEVINERELLNSYKFTELKADVLKIGHHGSHSSTYPEYLAKVNPKYAVITVGQPNDYGHPHKETMDLLKSKSIPVYRTDENGTIVVTSDGNDITFNSNPGDYSFGSQSGSSSSYKENTSSKTGTADTVAVEKPSINDEEKTYVDASGNGLIKGNINSKGEKIYHMPNGAHYKETIPEAYFKTEKEAQAAGFRKSKR